MTQQEFLSSQEFPSSHPTAEGKEREPHPEASPEEMLTQNLAIVDPKTFTHQITQTQREGAAELTDGEQRELTRYQEKIEPVVKQINLLLLKIGPRIKTILEQHPRTNGDTDFSNFEPGQWLLLRASDPNDAHSEFWTRDAAISWQMILAADNNNPVNQPELGWVATYSSLSQMAVLLTCLLTPPVGEFPLRIDSSVPAEDHNNRIYWQMAEQGKLNWWQKGLGRVFGGKPLEASWAPPRIDNPLYLNTSVFGSDYPVDSIPNLSMLLSETTKFLAKDDELITDAEGVEKELYKILADELEKFYQPGRTKREGFIIESNGWADEFNDRADELEPENISGVRRIASTIRAGLTGKMGDRLPARLWRQYPDLLVSGSNSFWADSEKTLAGGIYSYPNVLLLTMLRKLATVFAGTEEGEKWEKRAKKTAMAIEEHLLQQSTGMLDYGIRMRLKDTWKLTPASANIMYCLECLDPNNEDEHQRAIQILQEIDQSGMTTYPVREIKEENMSFLKNPVRITKGFLGAIMPRYHISNSWLWTGGMYILACQKHGLDREAKKCATNLLKLCEDNGGYPELVDKNGKLSFFVIRHFSNTQSWSAAAAWVAEMIETN